MGRKNQSSAAASNAAKVKTPVAAVPAPGDGQASEVTNFEQAAKLEAAATPTGGGAADSIPQQPEPITPLPAPIDVKGSMLFELYVARVAASDTVHTIRRDRAAIFGDALKEAKVALAVFNENAKGE